ncbi:MAG: hypothetical protein OIF40_00760 [Mangrovicoccus sp.]|nr:hypothetical protein [Mangrovicoccus sp.]
MRNDSHSIEPFLITDQNYVSLDRKQIQIVPAAGDHVLEFLEGLDIRDEAFEEWLRNQRARHWEDILKDAGSAFIALR